LASRGTPCRSFHPVLGYPATAAHGLVPDHPVPLGGGPVVLTEWGVSVASDLGDDPLSITNLAAWIHNPNRTGGAFPDALAAFTAASG
jgi:hypothetical protein